jgi:hypothetical protein
MSSKVSLDVFLKSMTDEEWVELSYKVLLSVLVLAVLNIEQVLDAAALLLQDTVNQEKGIGYQAVITLSSSHNLEEQSEVVLSLFFL